MISRSSARPLIVTLFAIWAFGALPLLALPIDWSIVCGCDVCPLGGGPTCCCRNYPTWANADGSPGKRAAIAHPSVQKSQRGCVGPAPLPSFDARPLATSPARHAFSSPRLVGAVFLPDAPAGWQAPMPLASLPRPPPVPA